MPRALVPQPTAARRAPAAAPPPRVTEAAASVAEGGRPLPTDLRGWFEPRLGHDFSRVRVHDDTRAAEAAEGVDARAFTLGYHIAFAPGEFAPSTRSGRALLAHELTHVVQAEGSQRRRGIARTPARRRRFSDRAGGGTTDFVETVENAPTRSGDVITGRVDRSEIAPAVGGAAEQEISRGHVNVRFDTRRCVLELPYVYNFIQQATANTPFCQDPPNATAVTPLPAADLQRIASRYVAEVNAGLRGWYTARMSGCQGACADRDIEIRAEATLGTTNVDRVMTVVNRGGRGNAGTLCAREAQGGFATHEAGHQVLGLGDEYREDDASLRQRNPTWARDERVRTDLTRMGNDASYGRFSLFNERHFRFAQVFLEAAFPGCTVSLHAVPRTVPDFRVELLAGYARTPGGGALTLGGAFNVGLPLTRLRQLEARLGVQGIYLSELAPRYRSALLLGATAALEGRPSAGGVSPTFGVFGSGGVYHQFDGGVPATPGRTSGYVEGGASLGLQTPMMGGFSLGLRLDAAFGTELTQRPDAMRWYRLGLGLGGTF